MKVRELMTTDVASCRKETNLAALGASMWEKDCGILPIVDETEKVTGVVTDRDICIALCTRNAKASELTAGDIVAAEIVTCTPSTDVRVALESMRGARIHRLPVVDGAGILQGIVSMDDIVMCAEVKEGKPNTGVPYEDVVRTLQTISAHHPTRPLAIAVA
jgi:CBS domain-containing protein